MLTPDDIERIRNLAQGILELTAAPPDFGPDVELLTDGPYRGCYVHRPSKRILTRPEVAGFLASWKPTPTDPGWDAVHAGLAAQGKAQDGAPPGEEPL